MAQTVTLCTTAIFYNNPGRKWCLDEIDRLEKYFANGGPFYHALQCKSKYIHWCTVYALSDLLDKQFQAECNHEYTHGDLMVDRCAMLFDDIHARYKDICTNANFSTTTASVAKKKWKGTIKPICDSIAILLMSNNHEVEVYWNKAGLSYDNINVLLLGNCIDWLEEAHLCYRGHLYVHRNQTNGEMVIDKQEPFVVKFDYMMKLCHEMWRTQLVGTC